ncbi:MAG TPA: T9SS type A sorting domain-containing protein [Flavobacterium sp.]|nr:T9SS type A sorting domain-containing protein [Flavobacterium sp.]
MNQIRFLKKGLFFLCLIFTSLSQAQTINTTYKTLINAKLAGLDKTKVPYSLLINQAMEFADLTDYSGGFTTTNFTTRGKYNSIYNTLLMARVQSNVTGLVSPVTFKTNWDNLRQPNKIVLSGLYYKYSKFRPDAYPNYLVNNNDVVTDKYVGGVWQNPYIDQQVFAIAAPILIYKSLSLQVTLPASLWYTNQSTSIQSIDVDFGNGAGYQSMSLGQLRTINYPASGIYEWKYKLTLTNAQILYSHSKLKIDVPVLAPPPTDPNSLNQFNVGGEKLQPGQTIIIPPDPSCANVATIPLSGTRQYLGVANTATLQIKYAQNDCIIRKPLIVVEGFDSGLLGIENSFGEISYRNFFESSYSSYNLYFQISQYDIIYINFNQGRDDLKRNAYLVEDIIKWVNTKKAQAGSATPNVVVGQSMGGLIARYALRDMEILGQAHQANLYISHDAPQQGANIPIGIQYFARHLADQFVSTPIGDYNLSPVDGANISISEIQNLMEAQGTKQLLSNYIDSGFGLNNAVFNSFQLELRSMGYPVQTRNIAISNGNHCANPQDFNPSALLFNLNGNVSTTALTTLLTVLIEPLTGITSAPLAYEFNEPGLLLGMLPGSSSFAMSFYANALPTAGTSNQVYHGNITYTKKIFSLFGWNPQITTSLTDRTYNNPVTLSYDYYPGGKYQLPFNFSITPMYQDFINTGVNSYLAPSFDFIPVPSSLDVGSGATILNNTDYLTRYNKATPPTGTKAIPFVNFTTSFPNGANINEPHISFNTRNGDWLATELDSDVNNNQVFDCTYICTTPNISGLATLCTFANYSIPPISGVTYNWSITQGNGLATISGNGTPGITLTHTGTDSGYITLSVTVYNSMCGSKTSTKTIWVGAPAFNLVRDSAEFCDSKWHYVIFNVNLPPDTTIQLSGIYPQPLAVTYGIPYYGAPYSVTLKYGLGFSGDISFIAVATNSCGTFYRESEEPTHVNLCSSIGAKEAISDDEAMFKIYPNPSNDIVNIDLRDQNFKPAPSARIIAQLYNMMGEMKRSVTLENNIASVNVTGLPRGVYLLKININNQIESHQVIVK